MHIHILAFSFFGGLTLIRCDFLNDVREHLHTPKFLSSLFERDAGQILSLQKTTNVHSEESVEQNFGHVFEDVTQNHKMIALNEKAVEKTERIIMGYKNTCHIPRQIGNKQGQRQTESVHDVHSIRNHTLTQIRNKVLELENTRDIKINTNIDEMKNIKGGKQANDKETERNKNIEQVLAESKLLPQLRFEIMGVPRFIHPDDFISFVQDLDCVDFVEEDSITFTAGTHIHSRSDAHEDDDHPVKNETNNLYFKYGQYGINFKPPRAYDGVLTEQIIAVVDVGFSHHNDLASAYYINPAENCPNFLDDDQNGYFDDCIGYNFLLGLPNPFFESIPHGTPIAGLIAGSGNDQDQTVEGICKQCKVMPLKAGSYGRFLRSAIAKAIEYASQMKVQVINASFGGKRHSRLECESIRRSVTHSKSLFVIASGNDGCNLDSECDFFPAECESENLLVVGGSNSTGHAATWSNYGRRKVHVFAPGQDIYTTLPGDSYKQTSGTSFAAPIVAAIVGDIMTRYPKLKTSQVRDIIMNSCNPVPHLQDKCECGGIVDHELALQQASDLYHSSSLPIFGTNSHPPTSAQVLDRVDIHRFNILNRLFHLFD